MQQLAEFLNDSHDNQSVHATYWEKICHVKDAMPFYVSKKGYYLWKQMAEEEIVSLFLSFCSHFIARTMVQEC